MRGADFVVFLNAQSTITTTQLLNMILEYLATNQQAYIAESIKGLMQRASIGDTTALSDTTQTILATDASTGA